MLFSKSLFVIIRFWFIYKNTDINDYTQITSVIEMSEYINVNRLSETCYKMIHDYIKNVKQRIFDVYY